MNGATMNRSRFTRLLAGRRISASRNKTDSRFWRLRSLYPIFASFNLWNSQTSAKGIPVIVGNAIAGGGGLHPEFNLGKHPI